MLSPPEISGTLLALDAGVRQTGWAVFLPSGEVNSGVIAAPGRRSLNAKARLSYLGDGLDQLVGKWNPVAAVHSQPSGIHWSVPALELLDAALDDWVGRHRLTLYAYTAQEVRTAVTGHPNVSKEDLAYSVMASHGMIGTRKSTHEWEAIAVGYYHLARCGDAAGPRD